jgi:hypothetical protein
MGYANGDLSIEDLRFTKARVISGPYGGPAVYASFTGTVLLKGLEVVDTSSYNQGGALNITANTALTIQNISIGNVQASFAGAIQAYSYGNITIQDTAIENASAVNYGGMSVSGFGSGSLTNISNVRLNNCTAESSTGGMYVSGSTNIAFDNVELSNCTGGSGTGGMNLVILGSYITLNNIRLTNCSSEGTGGGITVSALNTSLSVTNSQFINCRAKEAANLFVGFSVIIEDCSFTNCNARNSGKALSGSSRTTESFLIKNSSFVNDSGLVNLGAPTTDVNIGHINLTGNILV